MRIRFVLFAAALASPLAAQGNTALYSSWSGLGGFEYQRYGFDKGYRVQSGSQWSLPLVLVAPLGGHASVDLTTHYAHTEITDTATLTHSGLTDTQIRLLYTIGAQRAVASISINLPTGKHSFATDSFRVASGVSSTYLSFPVNNLGSAFGVTTGLAYATPAGAWNLGLAGSVRFQANYRPFTNDSLNYKPGLEGRLRVGADRLMGERGRLLLGVTFSTFSTDEFTGVSSSGLGPFNPGSRFITDVGYAYSWGRTSLTVGAWDYYRMAGSSGATTVSDTKENVFNTEIRLARQLSPRFAIEPLAAFRQWSPADFRGGRLYSFGANLRFGLSDQWSGVAGGRFGTGWVFDPSAGRSDVTATGLSLYLRYQR
jgi:hypothetical protein